VSQAVVGGASAQVVQGLVPFQNHGEAIRQCKIIGTLGPSSSNEETMRELVASGLNIARLNFSHGEHESHLKNIEMLRKISKETGHTITILQDLQGPKIRAGKLIGGAIELKDGEIYTLSYGVEQTDPKIIPIDYKDLVRDVKVGEQVMMDDGLLVLEVTEVKKENVLVRVVEGGILKNRKGVNFPDSLLSLPALTEKDSKDLIFGIANGVDVVALSFVQTASDVAQCKKIIHALGSDIPVIAKIEKVSAVKQIDEIAQIADGLMVARGDLGVEGRVERVPTYQHKIIEAAHRHCKPVIVATQMLESMIGNPRASFAEMADVANGVIEGADCLMLSGEVAAGKYPVESVRTMDAIIRNVENWYKTQPPKYQNHTPWSDAKEWEENEAIAIAACEAADSLKAKAIVCLSLTGSIARSIAKWRPHTPIIAVSPRKDAVQRLGLVRGVYGMQNPLFYNTDVLLQDLPNLFKNLGIFVPGDTIVVTAGIPINHMKPTNMLKINIIT